MQLASIASQRSTRHQRTNRGLALLVPIFASVERRTFRYGHRQHHMTRSCVADLARFGFWGVAAFLLSGCGTVSLKRSFDNYSDVYAETQDRQMLLNLARLSNREPIYFFQLAEISAGYTFTTTASLEALKEASSQTSALFTAPLLTHTNIANLGATATNSPVFTMIPLGGDKFATQLLAPIKPAVFYELFEEGWPIDLLMRVLIERIELVRDPTTEGGNGNATAGNAKNDQDSSERLEVMINDPLASDSGHYDRFLRACALERGFQRKGILYLKISNEFEPLAHVGFPVPPSDQQQLSADKQGLVWRETSPGSNFSSSQINAPPEKPTPRPMGGIAGSQPEHASQALGDGMYWQLGKYVEQTILKLNYGRRDQAKAEMERNPEFRDNDGSIEEFYAVLENGIGVTDTETEKNSYKVRLVMRSLLESMLAVANEQRNFGALDTYRDQVQERRQGKMIDDARAEITKLGKLEYRTTKDNKQWEAANEKLESLMDGNLDIVPESEDHPVLILNWPASYSTRAAFSLDPEAHLLSAPDLKLSLDPGTQVASVAYKGKSYTIGEAAELKNPALATWNRDVFRLLVQLSLQLTADPSGFALDSRLHTH